MSEGGGAATSTTDALTREAIARVDASGQLGDVLSLPEHLRDALWRWSRRSWRVGTPAAGRGGDGRLGDRGHWPVPRSGITPLRPIFGDARLRTPTWTTPETTVLCASYSATREHLLL